MGPCLTFCAAGKQRVLHDTLARVGKRIAEAALPRVPERADLRRADLEAIRDDPQAGVPVLR